MFLEEMDEIIEKLIENIKEKLTLEGKKRVFEEDKELKSNDLRRWQDPEEFTRTFLIDKLLFDFLNVEHTGPKNFVTSDGTTRKVDYAIKYEKNRILIEAKPINANLYDKSLHGAFNQIKGLFTLGIVQKDYTFGIATDGIKWIFIDDKGKFDELDIREDFEKIKRYIIGEEKISQKKLEDISKKFYLEYNDLLHGIKRISKEDCLINSILKVEKEEDREEIAQVIIDRLIFIKFLQSKGIIKDNVLDYLNSLQEYELNQKLNQLFFEVMNTKEKNRGSIDPHFVHIPYLNGSLFERLEVEEANRNYRIKANILKRIIEFLNKFRFIHRESIENQEDVVNPEILGYIFERAMTSRDRKGSGAYYTPKEITKYIAENTIYPILINKINNFLTKEKGYKKSELIKNIEEVYHLRETTLKESWQKIILEIKVCDNACGSGAFLLAVAHILFDINKKIASELKGYSKVTDTALKRMILRSLYGVDINPRAVEIAMLRLWLWLVESYKPEHVEPLPNIEYNIRLGNSLIGYVDIEQFGTTKVSLDDFLEKEETTKLLLIKFRNLKTKYRKSVGEEARKLKKEIEKIRYKIKKKLDKEFFQDITGKKISISKDEFLNLKPFHWGFEFYEIFDLSLPKEKRGFDVVIGNPPYVDYRSICPFIQTKIFKLNYYSCKHTKEKYSLYIPFIEASLILLNSGGNFCYINPSKWLVAFMAQGLRNYIKSNWHLYKIVNLANMKVFGDPTFTNLGLFFINKDTKEKATKIKYQPKNYNELLKKPVTIKEKDLFYEDFIVLANSSKTLSKILSSISDSKNKFENFVELEWGTSASGGNKLIISEEDYKKLSADEKKKYIPIIHTSNCKKYHIEWDGEYLPKSFYSENRIRQFSKNKVVIARRSADLRCSIDFEKYGVTKVAFNVSNKISLGKIAGILNSKLIDFWFKKIFESLHPGGSYQFDIPYLNYIPLPKSIPDSLGKLSICLKYLEEQESFDYLHEISNCIIYELYLKEELKTNFTNLIEPYIKDVQTLENKEEKLKVIKRVIELVRELFPEFLVKIS